MRKARHTPGEWTYCYSPYTSQDGSEIPAFEVHGDEKVCDTNEDRPAAEQEANARLIAAAPELLIAAEQVIASWESGDLAAAVRQLDTAIEFAKGDAPRNKNVIIVIAVAGGVAHVFKCPAEVSVQIIDLDEREETL